MMMLRRSIMPALFVLAVTIIGFQGRRIMALEAALDKTSSKSDGLAPGTVLPSFEALDLSGTRAAIAYTQADQRPTVLYIFSPSCIWCARNSAAIDELNTKLSDRYRIIGLSLDSENLAQYVADHHVRFPVYTKLPESVVVSYRLGPTPATIVVAPDGSVVTTWTGAYSGPTKLSVESFFSITLPDLS